MTKWWVDLSCRNTIALSPFRYNQSSCAHHQIYTHTWSSIVQCWLPNSHQSYTAVTVHWPLWLFYPDMLSWHTSFLLIGQCKKPKNILLSPMWHVKPPLTPRPFVRQKTFLFFGPKLLLGVDNLSGIFGFPFLSNTDSFMLDKYNRRTNFWLYVDLGCAIERDPGDKLA